jgi:DNA (cytosine-5)-methyltransferase 1
MSQLKPNQERQSRNTFDLFAGCGGLSTGLEFAGFSPLLVCELDEYARESFVINRSRKIAGHSFSELKQLHFGDVYGLADRNLPNTIAFLKELLTKSGTLPEALDLDLVCGGPPCQGYSGIGHRRSYSVEKKDIPSNRLYEPMAKIIEHTRPKIFLFENVKGILSGKWSKDGKSGEIWSTVLNRFKSIPDYTVKWNLVQAKNYGVPQNRPRVLMVGIRNDIARSANLDLSTPSDDAIKSGFLPEPNPSEAPDLIDLLNDLVDPKITGYLLAQKFPQAFNTEKYLSPPKNSIQNWLRTRPDGTIIKVGEPLSEQEYSRHSPQVVEKFYYMISNGGVIPDHMRTKKFAQRLLPKTWDPLRGPSITATSLPDDYVHYSQPRILTVREWARLQTFPDWYKFCGKRTTGGIRRAGNPLEGNFAREVPKYTQIGNAVPVKLAEKVGSHLNSILVRAGH